MRRWALAVLALGLGLLLAARLGLEPRREAWMLVGSTGDGSVALFRWSSGNTGFFADQVGTRVLVIPPSGSGLQHRAVRGAGQLGPGEVRAGPDRLAWTEAETTAVIGGDAVQVRAQLRAGGPSCPPAVGSLTGVVEFAPDGLTLDGDGLLVHQRALGEAEGFALYALSNTHAVGIDPWSDCPAWLRWPGGALAGAAEPWSEEDGLLRSRIGTTELSVRLTAMGLEPAPLPWIAVPERLLQRAAGIAPPSIGWRRAWVRIGDAPPIVGLWMERRQGLAEAEEQ